MRLTVLTRPARMNDSSISIVDSDTQRGIQAHRLQRICARLQAADCAAIVLFDPVNIRYATGTRNMQVWTMHNICRYTVVFASGDTVLFELGSSAHLAEAPGADIVDGHRDRGPTGGEFGRGRCPGRRRRCRVQQRCRGTAMHNPNAIAEMLGAVHADDRTVDLEAVDGKADMPAEGAGGDGGANELAKGGRHIVWHSISISVAAG